MEGGTVTLTCQEPSVVMIVPRGANVRWNLYYSFVSKENKLRCTMMGVIWVMDNNQVGSIINHFIK